MLFFATAWYQTLPQFVYAAIAWSFIIFGAVELIIGLQKATDRVQTLHKIPCSSCHYFTGDYSLKCTIHPSIALTEEAIDCSDYQEATDPILILTTASKEQH
ncbi:hypothetical protein ACQ4M3_32735 [Leptolyngbya sp. AN03gr2]|uniref:hypothetical protein n=1 Tax=unclassified Leptolyngbya TaxID=2650499 RepID=UPI003D312D51